MSKADARVLIVLLLKCISRVSYADANVLLIGLGLKCVP